MMRACSPAEVRQLERSAGAPYEDGTLMRRAAGAVADLVRRVHPGGGQVLALVGSGGNGGDALWAVADLAGGRDAWTARALLLGEGADGQALAAARAAGVEVVEHLPAGSAHELAAQVDVVVDGIVGLGARGGLSGAASRMAGAIAEQRASGGGAPLVVAVDLPSGVDPEGRRAPEPGAHVRADHTVTFTCAKPAHLLPATCEHCGEVAVVDIGLDATGLGTVVAGWSEADLRSALPVPRRDAHKYSRGVLGVVAGSEVYPGAAVLTSSAALHTGVGMLRYVGPRRAEDLVLAACPEAVPGEGRVQAWVLGPGTPVDDAMVQRRQARLARSGGPALLDAGALGQVACRPAGAPR
ncbi:yjeF N-terminal region [Kytococcus aerolatus]|uniref:Bifunctional NAD(P)H-hydrate repair enzyme Nnr n=1 Tax=Kytococcus aerolatus TaxID=592308 RepID=A0A212U872_9MICO|nr:NAD(P)H-hydrate epimerase [Kytococcus aerolatus]SNC74350.1 yjeF N-terminal region [Kytococcus aerolatus]